MSSSSSKQSQQHMVGNGTLQLEEDDLAANEGFKDEPPDQSAYFDGTNFDLDAFATSSLQAAASAVLAVQQQQTPTTKMTSNIPQGDMAELFASMSANQNAEHSDQADLSRSSSVGRPSLSGGECSASRDKGSLHTERHMWTPIETKALVDGCNKHGIGNWKAILNDKAFAVHFNGRTPGDLKDRFRTYFPDAYHELYPNAKTHTSRAVRSKAPDGKSIFEKGKTKERRPFTVAEDEVLRKGYEQFGSHWAVIAKNAVFEGRRKSTDLRDRFRNAFPSLYEQAGYKPRTKSQKKERRPSSGSGSFSHVDQSSGVQIDWQADALQRPALQPRSETSASAHSQAVSEHSELSEEEDSSDAFDFHKARSDSVKSSIGKLQMLPNRQSAATPSIERSLSRNSSRSEQVPSSSDGTRSPPGGITHPTIPPKVPAILRRTQSTKRASLKIGSLDQAVKTAYSKSSKEAALASHHQLHLQQQQLLQRGVQPGLDAFSGLQRPPLNQSVSVGWPPRFTWMPGGVGSSESTNLANMDLDQMDDIINNHSATELLSGDEGGSAVGGRVADEAMNVDVEQTSAGNNQPDFASLYQQLALAGNDNAANRALSIESFQDLLDPVLPLQNTQTGGWNQASNVPWTPISSANATMSNDAPFQASANTATRREHEHNQWAGDLLHRGNYSSQDQQPMTPQGFVSMASMHLPPSTQGIPTSRSADDALGQASRNDFTLSRPPMNEQINSTTERPALRPNELAAYSTPSVHELISRSARRQSYPPRPVGFGEDGDDLMQVYSNPPYPYTTADDIALLNSSAGGSLTLFPSLVNSQVSEYGQAGLMRRRRSTDTLRESTYSFAQPWRGNLMDSARQVEEQDEMAKESSLQGQREMTSASSRHGTSEHSRSISDSHTNEDDDVDAPSRAASVGNMDLIGQRDNVMYAESLPDLSSGIDTTGSGADSAFAHQHNLQISYDDMDLPSFLNRSPNFLHATTTSATTSFSLRPGMDVETQRSNVKAWSASNEAGRVDDFVAANLIEQRRDIHAANKGPSKSVNWTNVSDFGSLDRLEHLMLEGLHAPSSPLNANQGISGGTSFGYNGTATGSISNPSRRYPANNAWWSSGSYEKGAGGGTDAGYESV